MLTASPTASSVLDPELAELIDVEGRRQRETLCLIASENHVSPAVLAATGYIALVGAQFVGFENRIAPLANHYPGAVIR